MNASHSSVKKLPFGAAHGAQPPPTGVLVMAEGDSVDCPAAPARRVGERIVNFKYDSLQDPATLDQITAFFLTRIDAFVTAFRPRLQRIIESLDKA